MSKRPFTVLFLVVAVVLLLLFGGMGFKGVQMLLGLATLNHKKIEFYGRLTDQHGIPVAGAAVTGKISVTSGLRTGVDTVSATSDADGYFTMAGAKGESLVISVAKPGYVLATTRITFVYSHLWPPAERHVPDEKHPVDFPMWKLQGAEALAAVDFHLKLPYSDRPFRIDLLTGKVVSEGGDLLVSVDRPEGEVSSHTYQSWGFNLLAVNGGLIDSNPRHRVTFFAPAEGYQERLAGRLSTNSPSNWSMALTQGLFLKSRGGRFYSKIGLVLVINQYPGEDMTIDFHGNINTNSSRNWEATIGQ